MPYLTMQTGDARGQRIPLGAQPCRIGRESNLEVPLQDVKASRVHLEISLKDGNYVLRDLRSRNGTRVNGMTVTAWTLKEGDQIQIGETQIVFSLLETPKPAATVVPEQKVSVRAVRPPVTALPALGTASAASGSNAESFETLELNAPLALIAAANKTKDSPPTGAVALERSNRALRALYLLARIASESKSTDELWTALSEGLQKALEADRVTPILVDEQGHWAVRAQGLESKTATPFAKIPVSRTIVDYALRTQRSVLTATSADARFGQSKSIGEQGITSALCVPVVLQERVFGLLYADRVGGQDFTHEDQELFTAACLQVAPAMENLGRIELLLAQKKRLLDEIQLQHHLLGNSPALKGVTVFIQRAAPSHAVVLVLGESGTGKELVARAIHYNSPRLDAPFVVVNCAALSETLIESELFGHIKGSFTGASSDRAGRFEAAHTGTLFLDEIGELSNSCQTKLLRVLEQGEISRVGESRVRKVDVRVVAATNRDLALEVKEGRFREDLYYRLNVLSVNLPPLRDRDGDVRLLLDHYLRQAASRSSRARLEFSEEALVALLSYRWPGNVRELKNLTERLAVLCPHEVIGVGDLPEEVRRALPVGNVVAEALPMVPEEAEVVEPLEVVQESAAADAPSGTLAEMERAHILRILAGCGHNKKMAAEKLGIDRSTLYAKLRGYGILS